MEEYKLEESEEELTVLVGVKSPEEAGEAPGVRATKNFKFRERK